MKRILKLLAFTVALPVTLVVILVMLLQGCRRPVVCDPVHPATGPAGTGPGATGSDTTEPGRASVPGTQILETRSIFVQQPPVCDPVHIPPPPTQPATIQSTPTQTAPRPTTQK